MPAPGELPPSLAALAQRPPLGLGAARPDLDVNRLIQVLEQSIAQGMAQRQATQAGPARDQPTVTGMAPSWPAPPSHSQPAPGQISAAPGPPPPGPTKPMPPRRRLRSRTITLAACGAVAAAIVAFLLVPGGKPASSSSSSSASSHHESSPKIAPAASPSAAAKVLMTDDFSTGKIGWTDDYHQAAGAYTGTGAPAPCTPAPRTGCGPCARPPPTARSSTSSCG